VLQAAGMTLATISYLCPLAMVTKKPMHVITTLYVTTLITLVAVLTTSLGEQNRTLSFFLPSLLPLPLIDGQSPYLSFFSGE
jgi:hypothetical protein